MCVRATVHMECPALLLKPTGCNAKEHGGGDGENAFAVSAASCKKERGWMSWRACSKNKDGAKASEMTLSKWWSRGEGKMD